MTFKTPISMAGVSVAMAIGLQLEETTSALRLTAVQVAAGIGGQGDNGPDFKLVASAARVTPVPIPAAG
jgi:hypothetical protein